MRKALDIAAGREISTATHVLRRAAAYYLRAFHDIDWEKVEDHTPEDDERWYNNRLGMRLHRQSEEKD
jgi:hypothetical protein